MARTFIATLECLYFGTRINTGFQYIADVDTNGEGAVALSNALGFTSGLGNTFPDSAPFVSVARDLANIFPESLVFSGLSILTPYDDTDFFEVVFPSATVGARSASAGSRLPAFLAASIRSNRVRRSVRRSFKRIPGLLDPDVNSNNLDPVYLALLSSLALQCSANLPGTAPSGTTYGFTPSVFKQLRVPLSEPARYEFPATETELIDISAIGIQYAAEAGVTTQNSRKP